MVFSDKPILDYRRMFHADAERAGRFNQGLREGGVFKSPGKTYPSLALTEDDFEITRNALEKAVHAIMD